jgi:hypothetical protein
VVLDSDALGSFSDRVVREWADAASLGLFWFEQVDASAGQRSPAPGSHNAFMETTAGTDQMPSLRDLRQHSAHPSAPGQADMETMTADCWALSRAWST